MLFNLKLISDKILQTSPSLLKGFLKLHLALLHLTNSFCILFGWSCCIKCHFGKFVTNDLVYSSFARKNLFDFFGKLKPQSKLFYEKNLGHFYSIDWMISSVDHSYFCEKNFGHFLT